jgi:hypothetical protein
MVSPPYHSLLMIARVGNNQTIMGEYKNGRLSNTFVRLAFGIMTIAVLILFYSFL